MTRKRDKNFKGKVKPKVEENIMISILMWPFRWLFKWVKGYDFYGVPIAPMNFKGAETMKTFYGGFFSLAVKAIMLTFILNKFNEMLRFSAPAITQLLLQGTSVELGYMYGEEDLGNTSLAI
jgi:hypothetical protein